MRRTNSVTAAFALSTVLLASGLAAERVGDVPNPRVRDGTWVTDLPSALQSETVGQLNRLISEVERETSVEMAVVVIRSLDGKTIEDFALELFNLWGIGKAESDNGLLFLWATDDRRVRIEVGDGLREIIPDSRAGYVLDSFVIPRFKKGEFDDGVVEGVGVLATMVRGESAELPPEAARAYSEEEEAAPEEAPPPKQKPAEPVSWGAGPTSPWLLAPGLGAVVAGLVGFRRWRRYRKRNCPSCRASMVRLGEKADDSYLEEGGRAEERVGSVDYDVWRCSSCEHHFILRYPKWFSGYKKCPQCSYRTCSKKRTTIRAATTTSSGTARVTETCHFCRYRRTYTVTIPRRASSSSSGGSSFGGGSSSGGGASRGY